MTVDIYTMRADLAKALAHPLRMMLLSILLDEGEKCVCELVDKTQSSQSTVSKHLAVLRDSGIVEARKEGLMVFYSVRTPCIGQFFHCIDRILKSDLEIKQIQLQEVGQS